jgi:hypothetical protein
MLLGWRASIPAGTPGPAPSSETPLERGPSRSVLLTLSEFGRPYGRAFRRAMSNGALTRAQKELIATMVSAINVCEY